MGDVNVGPSAGASGGSAGAAGTGQAAAAGSSGSAAGATAGAAGAAGGSSTEAGCEIGPITDEMRSRYENMDEDYYQKYASADGVIVATGEKVSDEALIRYCRLLGEMVSNDKVRDAVIADKMWFTMIDEDEQLSDLPQIARAYGTSLNQRARGLGGLTPTICAEDSIMCLPGDRWNGDCICPHEAGHTLYSSGIARVPDLSDRLTEITQEARSSGRLANAYVWQDGNESGMMAWGVQVWYDCAIDGMMGGYHSDINTRAELQQELPEFYQFLSELLPADNKYEDCYANP
jgi:alpha-glucosidase